MKSILLSVFCFPFFFLATAVRVYSIIPFLTPAQPENSRGPCQDELLVICGMEIPSTRRADFDARACLSDNLDQVQESCEEFLTYQFPSIVNKCHREIESYCSLIIDYDDGPMLHGQDLSDDRFISCLLSAQDRKEPFGLVCSAAMKEIEIEHQLLTHEDSAAASADLDEFKSYNLRPLSKTAGSTSQGSKLPLFAAALDKLKSVSLWFTESPTSRRRNTVTVEREDLSSYTGSWSLTLPVLSEDIDSPSKVIVSHRLRMQRRQDRLQIIRHIRTVGNQHDNEQLRREDPIVLQEDDSQFGTNANVELSEIDDAFSYYSDINYYNYYYYYSDDDIQVTSASHDINQSGGDILDDGNYTGELVILRGKGYEQNLRLQLP